MDVQTIDLLPRQRQRGEVRLLEPARLARAKLGFVPRRVPIEEMTTLVGHGITPRAGDLVLARVTRLGQHNRLQLANGRRSMLFIGDEVVLCYGNRYAPNQFEALVPDDLSPCHLVASGGIAATAHSKHSRMRAATRIAPIGLIGARNGKPLNLADYALPAPDALPGATPPVIAVIGTTMDAGKTTAAAHLIRGGMRAGFAVAAAKATGTGAGNDRWLMEDAGANPVLDFTDLGYPSTYKLDGGEVEKILDDLLRHSFQHRPDLVIIEIADGLYQQETEALLKSAYFRRVVDGVIFCAGDAMGAAAGVAWLQQQDVPMIGVSGALTASSLAIEEARRATDLPVYGRDDLGTPDVVRGLLKLISGNSVRLEA